MIETKVIQVANDPDVINKVNEVWGSFGWSVMNVQITHSQNTKTYSKGLDWYTGNHTVETTTIDYATITYQRDKEMKNYAAFSDMERRFILCLDELNETRDITDGKNKLVSLIGQILCWVIGFAQVIYFNTNPIRALIGIAVALLGPRLIEKTYMDMKGNAVAEQNQKIQLEREQICQRMEEILTQARQLH